MHSLDSLTSVSKYQRGFSHFITGDRIAFSLTNSSFTELPSPDAMSFSENIIKKKIVNFIIMRKIEYFPAAMFLSWGTPRKRSVDNSSCRNQAECLQLASHKISAKLWHKADVFSNSLSIRQVT